MLLALLIISTNSKGLVGKSELLVSNFVELSISISSKYDSSAIKEVDLKLVWDPPWTKDKMSEEAKLELNL